MLSAQRDTYNRIKCTWQPVTRSLRDSEPHGCSPLHHDQLYQFLDSTLSQFKYYESLSDPNTFKRLGKVGMNHVSTHMVSRNSVGNYVPNRTSLLSILSGVNSKALIRRLREHRNSPHPKSDGGANDIHTAIVRLPLMKRLLESL